MTEPLNPSFIAAIAAFEGTDKSRPEIAKLLGISRSAVSKIIRLHGLSFRTRKAKGPRVPLTSRKVAPLQVAGRVQITKAATSCYAAPRSISVTLPAPPWGDLEISDRRETAPGLAAIRDPEATWQKDRILASAGRVKG